MTFNLAVLPTEIDAIHLALAILALFSIVLLFVKSKSPKNSLEEASSTNTPKSSPSKTLESAEMVVKKEAPAIKEVVKTVVLKESTPDAALQLLALLQQDARFIDFIKEDLTGFSDADIGAAARVVHEGSKKTLDNYFTLTPIMSEDEETSVTLTAGFNASEIRLTGNVVGEAPFKGVLLHKGWKVTDIKLPKLSENHDATIVASAEVEL